MKSGFTEKLAKYKEIDLARNGKVTSEEFEENWQKI